MAARPLPPLEPDQTRMNAAAPSALSMQEQAIQGGKKVICGSASDRVLQLHPGMLRIILDSEEG